MNTNQLSRRGIARHLRPGFSLLELTLVLVILGILMGVAAVSVLGQTEKAKITATKATLAVIKNAITQYHAEHSAFPPDINTLVTTRVIEPGKTNDAWKRPLFYDPVGPDAMRPFVLYSKGPDGLSPSPDDVDSFDGVPTQPTQPQ